MKKLSEDSTVSNALKAHNLITKAYFKMGPSDKLNKDVAEVEAIRAGVFARDGAAAA